MQLLFFEKKGKNKRRRITTEYVVDGQIHTAL